MQKPEFVKTDVFGQLNISVNKNVIDETIRSIESIVNLDALYNKTETCFVPKTIKSVVKFVKIAERNNEKDTQAFIKEEVYPVWKDCFNDSVEEIFAVIEDLLPREYIITYIFGLYLAAHSSRMSDKEISKKDFIKYLFAEMFILAAQRAQQTKKT